MKLVEVEGRRFRIHSLFLREYIYLFHITNNHNSAVPFAISRGKFHSTNDWPSPISFCTDSTNSYTLPPRIMKMAIRQKIKMNMRQETNIIALVLAYFMICSSDLPVVLCSDIKSPINLR